MSEITLDEWLDQRRQEIDRFADYWSDSQAREGRKCWPEKMNKADWDEQLVVYGEIAE